MGQQRVKVDTINFDVGSSCKPPQRNSLIQPKNKRMKNQVGITGKGLVTRIGIRASQFWTATLDGRSGVRRIQLRESRYEDLFHIQIPDDALERFKTANDLTTYLGETVQRG
jgi:hypothetical protein